jgi:tripartite-type tricarboxylate transporter receptor subunit TctC
MLRSCLAALAFVSLAVNAQPYPSKPVRLLVGNAPGAGPDYVARLLANHMARGLGQPWVVENRPGADGMIAAEATARSAPDGYTLMLSSQGPVAIDMHIRKSLPIDPAKDLVPIAIVVDETTGMAVAVHPSLPVKSLPELIAYTKKHPGKLSFSTTIAYGTMFGEWLQKKGGMDMVEVRYKAGSQAIQDVVSGRVPVALQSPGSLAAQVKSGQMRFLAFATSKRVPEWGDIPIVAETFPGFSMRGFMVLVAPSAVPRDVVVRLNQESAATLKDAKFLQELQKIYWFNYEGARTPDGAAEFVRQERDRWGRFVRDIELQPQ